VSAGFVAPGFEPVAALLESGTEVTVGDRVRRVDLGNGGGALAAYVNGECVVDIWAGPGWERDTRGVIMSSTKGLTTLCAHLLADRGRLDVDAPVVEYWPEFGRSDTLVRHVLSHQSGAIGFPDGFSLPWDGTGWDDTARIAAAVAAAEPAWEPGTRHGYHGVTYGWLVGELVRRISGVSLGSFFRREVAEPLGLACDIGTPAPALAGVAPVMEFGSGRGLRAIDPATPSGRSVLAGPDGSLFADAAGLPRFATFMNTPAVLQAEIGAINATATARALAGVYAAVLSGSLVSPASMAAWSTEQVCGKDAVMRVPTRWALGYTRESPAFFEGLPRQHGPNDEAFGHMGAGGQIGFADPVAGVACGFIRNHLENQAFSLMGACLVDALYGCLDRR
jgi:CubicO group peptidase (beta-lactamase class C family)